ncbi:MAG: 1,2-phenylacetyl-CoA epoxidase subunit PaaC [Pseudomonadota bacterium]
METQNALFQLLLRLADDHLILGHRLSEWCGHAPMLEEDLALPNMALDVIGTARGLYQYAAEVEGAGKTEDDYAYLREEREFRNCILVERPNEDFAHTMLRQLYFAAFMRPFWEAMAESADETLRGIAGKAVKEVAYHIRHSGEWVIRMGDGTEESAARMKAAVETLHPYALELFETDEVTDALANAGIAPDPAAMRAPWDQVIGEVFGEALLTVPETVIPASGGRSGFHQEALGHLLSNMQYLQRANPGATW